MAKCVNTMCIRNYPEISGGCKDFKEECCTRVVFIGLDILRLIDCQKLVTRMKIDLVNNNLTMQASSLVEAEIERLG